MESCQVVIVMSRSITSIISAAVLGIAGLAICGFSATSAQGATVVFFDGSQSWNQVANGETSDTYSSNGYLFTYSQDKLFTGGVGLTEPIGRTNLTNWPDGIHAQGVSAGANAGKARLTVERVDGEVFDIKAFTFNLWASTAGAGAQLEIMPIRTDGEDAFNDPLGYEASGYYGMSFSYNQTPTPFLNQSTVLLHGYQSYTMTLYADFALTSLTIVDATVLPEPAPIMLMGLGAIALTARRRVRRLTARSIYTRECHTW